MSNVKVDPLVSRSELKVRNVSDSDYGAYECVGRNTEGERERIDFFPPAADIRKLAPFSSSSFSQQHRK